MIEQDKQSARSLEQPAPVESENFQATAGRRRFLKGLGIGLPAVMTLRSGALLAATSSKCAVNAHNNPPSTSPAKFAKAGDDQLFRSKGMTLHSSYNQEYYKYTTSYNPTYKITPTDVFKSNPPNSTCYDSNGLSPPIFSPSSITVNNSSHTVVCDDYTNQGDGPYYALCYVDDNGVVQSCSPSDTGNPVSQSCALNSFTN